jgi:MFS family permease
MGQNGALTSSGPPPADRPTTLPRRRGLLVDLSPVRQSPAFARLWIGSSVSGVGAQLTLVAVGLEIYDITRSTFSVALVGVISLVPIIVAGLYGGMLADAFDRRIVAILAAIVAWATTGCIALHAYLGLHEVGLLYALTAIDAVAATVINTSRSAIIPRLVPSELLPAASALGGIGTGFQLTVGPALAGILVAWIGFPGTYTVDVVLFSAAFLGIFSLPAIKPEGESQRPGIASLMFGVRFLRRSPNIRMTFVIDIIAMTFGQPRVLFPVVGALLIGGGAISVGVLTAAGAVGALLCSLFSGRLGHVRHQGAAVNWAVSAYGVCILAFGLVLVAAQVGGQRGIGSLTQGLGSANLPALAAAAVALAAAGAADNVSSIFRNTILQTAAPDAMRGRLQGIFIVVVTGGPRIGDLFVGLLAFAGTIWPPLLGGALIIALVGLLARVQPGFRRYDARNPTP